MLASHTDEHGIDVALTSISRPCCPLNPLLPPSYSSPSSHHPHRQVYLGGYEEEGAAAQAYDLAVLRSKGPGAITNFPPERYRATLAQLAGVSIEEMIMAVRRQSQVDTYCSRVAPEQHCLVDVGDYISCIEAVWVHCALYSTPVEHSRPLGLTQCCVCMQSKQVPAYTRVPLWVLLLPLHKTLAMSPAIHTRYVHTLPRVSPGAPAVTEASPPTPAGAGRHASASPAAATCTWACMRGRAKRHVRMTLPWSACAA